MSAEGGPPTGGSSSFKAGDDLTDEDNRFVAELEFVQCLANPRYLGYLASPKMRDQTVDNPDFVEYLRYLLYWKQPEYARFIKCPHALFFLDQLQHRRFREELKKPQFVQVIMHHQTFFYWLSSEHK